MVRRRGRFDHDGGFAHPQLSCSTLNNAFQAITIADRQGKRWYPTVEGLADGSVVVLGGDKNGG